mmetsp:Transcript_133735/g.346188  ORF Transcript_133735/g.346188 Transcript_133735/m.346188 type:complete len:138 (-) Transcript_133735:920-1333(-)
MAATVTTTASTAKSTTAEAAVMEVRVVATLTAAMEVTEAEGEEDSTGEEVAVAAVATSTKAAAAVAAAVAALNCRQVQRVIGGSLLADHNKQAPNRFEARLLCKGTLCMRTSQRPSLLEVPCSDPRHQLLLSILFAE